MSTSSASCFLIFIIPRSYKLNIIKILKSINYSIFMPTKRIKLLQKWKFKEKINAIRFNILNIIKKKYKNNLDRHL